MMMKRQRQQQQQPRRQQQQARCSRQLHTPTNILLLALAVSDFLVGLLVLPGEVLLKTSCWFLGDLLCLLYNYVSFIITSSSIGDMVLISVDRYVAICDPLHYTTRVTVKRVKLCVCLCWLCAVSYCSLLLKDDLTQPGRYNSCHGECVIVINHTAGAVDLVVTFIVPISVIVVLYMRVFVVAVSQARAMRSHITAVTLQLSVNKKTKKSELKAARTLGVLVVVFLICFCPYYCVALADKRNEGLVSPPIHHVPQHDGYTMLATNVPLFHEINEMPLILDPAKLDEGGGIESTLRRNQVKYHMRCRLMFNNTKLDHVRKQKSKAQSSSEIDEDHTKHHRTSHDGIMTTNLNNRVHECARTLNDGRDIFALVLSELLNYIVETSLNSDGPAISSQPSVSQKQRVLLTGDGGRLMKNGRSSRQPIHQWQRVANNSPSVAANQVAVEGADWVSSAQHCATANVSRTNNFYKIHREKKQLHTPTNILLLSLSVSDFLVGLLVIPGEVLLKTYCWFLGDLMCFLYYYVSIIIVCSSIGNMVLISVDRYVAICDPLHYTTRVTVKRVKLCVCLCWLCVVSYSSLLLKDDMTQPGRDNSCHGECVTVIVVEHFSVAIDLVVTFIVPISVIVVLYMRVFVVAVSQARAMRSHITAVTLQLSVNQQTKKSELKAARTLGVLVVVFLICYCPYYCVALAGNMVLISVDRYVAICDPLHYTTRVTVKRVKLCVCLCWLCAVSYCSLLLKDDLTQPGRYNSCHGECVIVINHTAGAVDLVVTFIVPISVIVVLYMRVFVVAVSQARAMRSHITAVTLQLSVSQQTKKSELKAARTLGVLVAVFLICFCPYYCVILAGDALLVHKRNTNPRSFNEKQHTPCLREKLLLLTNPHRIGSRSEKSASQDDDEEAAAATAAATAAAAAGKV
ncbi:hypothetical protein ABVT39_002395 [Epinephelus coioides]